MGAKKQHKSHADLGLTEVPMRVCVPLLENNQAGVTSEILNGDWESTGLEGGQRASQQEVHARREDSGWIGPGTGKEETEKALA